MITFGIIAAPLVAIVKITKMAILSNKGMQNIKVILNIIFKTIAMFSGGEYGQCEVTYVSHKEQQ